MLFTTVFTSVSPWIIGGICSVAGGLIGWACGSSAAVATAATTFAAGFASSISYLVGGLIGVLGAGVSLFIGSREKK